MHVCTYLCEDVFYAFIDLHFNMAYELVGSMPKDFKKTMGYIRQHFTDDEANDILSSSNHFAANEKIVGTLLLHIKQNEDIYKFWNIIESIKDAPQLSAAVESVKKSELCESNYTICVVYLKVISIWRFGKFLLAHQIYAILKLTSLLISAAHGMALFK